MWKIVVSLVSLLSFSTHGICNTVCHQSRSLSPQINDGELLSVGVGLRVPVPGMVISQIAEVGFTGRILQSIRLFIN